MKTLQKLFVLLILNALLNTALFSQIQVFISELADPSDDYNGRFIELYNPDDTEIDLNNTILWLSRQSNGGTTWGDVQLSGTIAPHSTYVIGGTGFEGIYGFPPDLLTGILTGNGNDAYVLFSGGNHSDGTVIDIFGEIDTDGTGLSWDYADSRALRLPSISTPNPIWNASEWQLLPALSSDCDPGTHSIYSSEIPSDTTLSLVIPDDTIFSSTGFTLPVEIHGLTTEENIIAYQFTITFDTLFLEFDTASITGTTASSGTLVFNPQAGHVSFSYMNTNPLYEDGPILTMTFIPLRLGETVLEIRDAYLNETQLSNLKECVLTIAESDPPHGYILSEPLEGIRFADTVLLTAFFNEPISSTIPVTMDITGSMVIEDLPLIRQNDTMYSVQIPIISKGGDVQFRFSSGTDLWGNAIYPIPDSGIALTVLPFVPGDVDDNGQIMAYDAALTLQYSAGLDPLPEVDPLPWSPWRDSTANVDRRTGITAYDAALILQYSAGLITEFTSILSKKAATGAGIAFRIVDQAVRIYPDGEILGLNLKLSRENSILDLPEILEYPDVYFASNINSEEINLAYCSMNPLDPAKYLASFPILDTGTVNFILNINGENLQLFLDINTFIHEKELPNIHVYPNPANNILHIQGLSTQYNFRILDICGKEKMNRTQYQKDIINVSSLESGMYFLLILSDNQKFSFKLLIE